jgi:uncharacterized coiled-coil DUF342 family protein
MPSDPDSSAHRAEILKMQLNDAHEVIRKIQRRARYLHEELSKEISRRRQLEAEIEKVHAEIAERSASAEKTGPNTNPELK